MNFRVYFSENFCFFKYSSKLIIIIRLINHSLHVSIHDTVPGTRSTLYDIFLYSYSIVFLTQVQKTYQDWCESAGQY